MKEIIGIIAVILTFVAYIPYYRDILKGKTRPHIYSWSLWGLLTILLVALQIKGGAGPATWVTAAAGLLCIGVVFLSLKNGKKDITTSDTIVAILALLAIVFWLIVHQPVISFLPFLRIHFITDGLNIPSEVVIGKKEHMSPWSLRRNSIVYRLLWAIRTP